MNEDKPKRPILWWRLWPVPGFLGLGVWEYYTHVTTGAPINWVWVGIALAGALFVIILRVFMRV